MTAFLADVAGTTPLEPLERATKSVKVTKAAPSRNKVVAGLAFSSGAVRSVSSGYDTEQSKAKRAAPPTVAHLAWTEKAVFQSLRLFGRQGVSEMVVTAIIQKRASAEGLTGVSIVSVASVLKKMAKAKRISTSSGRWFAL